jgi:SM-20-related protein
MSPSSIDLGALRATPLKREPYDYLVVPNFVPPAAFEAVVADYPAVDFHGGPARSRPRC